MKKKVLLSVLVVIVCIAICVCGYFFGRKLKSKNDEGQVSTIKIESVQDMEDVVKKIYEKINDERPAIETREVPLDDEYAFEAYTGLNSKDGVDKVVVSESMINVHPYSLALVYVKDDANVEEIKQKMVDNVDMRRWVCVNADVVYATNSGNLIFMVMADEEQAKKEYDAFKEIAENKIGKELSRNFEEADFNN